jgi:molybdopterin-guanine dinucleotide biosynthesis protein
MKVVVVGGHTRNIGKTSVAAALIQELRRFNWTAIKITQYGHGICSRDGKSCQCAPGRHAILLSEETDPHGHADTCRLLAAGARRSLWLRVRQGQLGSALPALERALSGSEYVLIESNSILAFVRPLLYLAVLDSGKQDFKESARKFLAFADALVPVGWPAGHPRQPDARPHGHNAVPVPQTHRDGVWPGIDPAVLANKPLFPVTGADYFNCDLFRFVRSRLMSGGNDR